MTLDLQLNAPLEKEYILTIIFWVLEKEKNENSTFIFREQTSKDGWERYENELHFNGESEESNVEAEIPTYKKWVPP